MNILEVRNISKTYGKTKVLNQVSLNVQEGKVFGLLGPNGAGKTTLIRIINQIIVFDEGEVLISGRPMTRNDISRIGYLPEERGLYTKMPVGEHLLYLAHLKGLSSQNAKKVIRQYLDEFDIGSWWYKKVEQLSKGMQQKLQFIIAIMHQPDLVILDEPFTGFDPVNIELVKNKIRSLKATGTTFILSTHRMDSVEELCDDIVLINKSNKIMDGNKMDIKEKYKQNIFEIISATDPGKVQISGSNKFDFLDAKPIENGLFKYNFRLQPAYTANDLVQAILDVLEVKAFSEKIPTVNEIFISLVNE